MKQKWSAIGLFVLCLIVGFSLVTQSKVTNGQKLYVSAKTISDYQTTIASEQKDKERIDKLIEEAAEKLAEYETLAESENTELRDKLLEELNHYRMASGTIDVRGDGVIVQIDDATRDVYEWEDINAILVHDLDLLMVINDLARSGAEAISVNGQRITNTTAISCSGYTVHINGQFFARPFEIRAIGDSKRMAAALIGIDGYGTLLKESGILFKVSMKDDMVISRTAEDRTYQYMTKAKEGEGI